VRRPVPQANSNTGPTASLRFFDIEPLTGYGALPPCFVREGSARAGAGEQAVVEHGVAIEWAVVHLLSTLAQECRTEGISYANYPRR
jgi:hypothetical protein